MRPYERGWILNPSTHLKNKQNRRGYAPVTPRWVGRDRGIPGLAGQVQWETFSDTKVDCSWGRHSTPVYDLHMHVHPGANTYICVHTHHSIRNHVISAISPTAYLPGITERATHEDERAAGVEGAHPWSQLRESGDQGQPHLLLHVKSEVWLRCTSLTQSKTTQRTDSEAGSKH